MTRTFTGRAKGFLLDPVQTFTAAREDSLGSAFSYYVILLIIFAVLNAVVLFGLMRVAGQQTISGLIPVVPGAAPLWMVGGAILLGIGGAIIAGAVLHIFVYIVGGRMGIGETLKALMYSATPALMLGWIPVINVIAGIWGIILLIVGLRELHQFSTSRAVLSLVIPLVLAVILTMVMAGYLSLATAGAFPR